MNQRKQLANRLLDVSLFSRCDPRDLRIVARHTTIAEPAAEVKLVTQGQAGDALFVLLDGSARVERDEVVVAELGPGDYFGELALLDPAPRAATVTTTAPSVVAVLDLRMFRVLLRDVPPLSAELLAQLARRVRDAGAVPTSAEVGF
ncbi:MAG: cyclic nucleotide-binding domain-containing protein [Acidimicrobiia bacterium]|nr:cyclic nucleotide-binding domain-containing protein [Acidimicrobiia bacterium]